MQHREPDSAGASLGRKPRADPVAEQSAGDERKPTDIYMARATRFDRVAAAHERTVRGCARWRLAVFVAAVVGVWGLVAAGMGAAAWGTVAVLAVAFGLLVARQQRARGRQERAALMADFNREGIARLERRWDDLPLPPKPSQRWSAGGRVHAVDIDSLTGGAADLADNAGLTNGAGLTRNTGLAHNAGPSDGTHLADQHDYASDLDLDGRASLLHLAGVCGTAPGWRTLRGWLLAPAAPAEVRLRQEAVREMALAFDFRDLLAAEARLVGVGAEALPDFARSSGTPHTLAWARVASWALPPVNVAAIALNAAAIAPMWVVGWALVLSTLSLLPRWKAIHRRFDALDDRESGVRRYGPLLAHIHGAPLSSPLATSIRRRLGGLPRHPKDPAASDPTTQEASWSPSAREARRSSRSRPPTRAAHREVATLRRLLDVADTRRSPLFHIPLAVVLHWDVHVLAALERWTRRCGHLVGPWIDAVGEVEALAALAALAADHPDWTMPELAAGDVVGTESAIAARASTTVQPGPDANQQPQGAPPPIFHSRSLGHPLLPPAACVRNDVDIGPPGSFLLVTGSNMSGKSTLLRAVGLNAILAQAGGPVCAAELRMPPLRVVTSMRVEDSLADGVSRFMAGLRRLKLVVDAARASSDVRPVLYLLDEILQGTNSAERRIAARTVLRHLLSTGGIGAVTTHDLSLADAADLTARAVAVHFTESVGTGAQLSDSADGRDAGTERRDSADGKQNHGEATLAFDYRLRTGIATSTNAIKLLDMVGLGRE